MWNEKSVLFVLVPLGLGMFIAANTDSMDTAALIERGVMMESVSSIKTVYIIAYV